MAECLVSRGGGLDVSTYTIIKCQIFLFQHVKDRAHVDFVSDKHNYEKLDEVISQGPSIADFLQSVLLSHCQLQAANRPVSIRYTEQLCVNIFVVENDQTN